MILLVEPMSIVYSQHEAQVRLTAITQTWQLSFKAGVALVVFYPCRQASRACLILISSIFLRCCAVFKLCYQFTTAAFRRKYSQYIAGFWCFYCPNLLFLLFPVSLLRFRLARSIHSISSSDSDKCTWTRSLYNTSLDETKLLKQRISIECFYYLHNTGSLSTSFSPVLLH